MRKVLFSLFGAVCFIFVFLGSVYADVPLSECPAVTGYSVELPKFVEPVEIDGPSFLSYNMVGQAIEICDQYPETPWSLPMEGWYCNDDDLGTLEMHASILLLSDILYIDIENTICDGYSFGPGHSYALTPFPGNEWSANYYGTFQFNDYLMVIIAIVKSETEITIAFGKLPNGDFDVVPYTVFELSAIHAPMRINNLFGDVK